jgi:hypothetical protein
MVGETPGSAQHLEGKQIQDEAEAWWRTELLLAFQAYRRMDASSIPVEESKQNDSFCKPLEPQSCIT